MTEVHRQLEAFRGSRDIPQFTQFFLADPKRLERMMQCIYDQEPYPYKEYGSWLFSHMVKNKSVDGLPYYNRLVDTMFETEDQTLLRNVANCLLYISVQEYRESELFDLLLGFVNNASNKVALQMYAIRMLMQLCEKYPELIPEVREVIHLNKEGKTAAYNVAVRDFEKKFKS